MNKEITIIELIDMYVEDVVQPKKVKFGNNIYIYNGNSVLQQIINKYKGDIVFLLNDKVEIIEDEEENKNDIEELNLFEELQTIINSNDLDLIVHSIHKCFTSQKIKINELIKEVNKLRKDNK